MDLEKARSEIAAIDKEIAALFERRMAAAAEIAKYKREQGLPVRDEAQEERVLRRNAQYIEDPDKISFYLDLVKQMMRCTREYEQHLMDGEV